MSYQINPRQQLVSPELLDAYRSIPSSTIGHFSDRGFLRGIKPLFNNIRMVGNVVTVKVFPPDGSILREALLLSEPGDVLVIECVGDEECGCWGELRTLAGLIKGLAGVVVSGAVTDVSALRRHGLPMFCRDVSAYTTRGIGAQGEVNQPIRLARFGCSRGTWPSVMMTVSSSSMPGARPSCFPSSWPKRKWTSSAGPNSCRGSISERADFPS